MKQLRFLLLPALLLILGASLCWAGLFGPGNYGAGMIKPGGLPFPSDNLLAWYRNDVGLTLDTTGGTTTVAYWADSSGNGYDLEQSTKSKQPLYADGGIDCDGSNDELFMIAGKLDLLRNKPGAALYMVINVPASETNKFVWWVAQGSSTTSYRHGIQIQATDKFNQLQRRVDGGSGFGLANTNAFTTGAYHLHSDFVDYTGNDAKLYRNGVLEKDGAAGSTGTFSDTDSGEIAVCSSGGADYTSSLIKEMIVASSPANLAEFNAYLVAKYGF